MESCHLQQLSEISQMSDGDRQILYDFTRMWNLKTKQNKRANKIKQEQTHSKGNRLVVTRGKGVAGGAKWVKRVNCMEMDGNQAYGGDHFECMQMSNYIMLYTTKL